MANYKTPGVYVEEISKFPPSVAQVETAIPAFIGYTEKAEKRNGDTLTMIPKRISSILEYETYFGGADYETTIDATITDTVVDGVTSRDIKVAQPSTPSKYLMFYSMQMYFANGGGPCYIVSVGDYSGSSTIGNAGSTPLFNDLVDGLGIIRKEDEPTLLLFPDATNLGNTDDFYSLYNEALKQCSELQDRFTIIDTEHYDEENGTPIEDLRDKISNETNYIKYGGAYYPFLETILDYRVADTAVNIVHVSDGSIALDDDLLAAEDAEADIITAEGDAAASNAAYIVLDTAHQAMTNANALINKPIMVAGVQDMIDLMNDVVTAAGVVVTSLGVAAASAEEVPAVATAATTAATNITNATNGASSFGLLLTQLIADAATINGSATGAQIKLDSAAALPNMALVESEIAALIIIIAAGVTAIENAQAVDVDGHLNGLFLSDIKLTDNDTYNEILTAINALPITLPPSSSMAGIYARIDSTRGVWKAPANVSLNYVIRPTVQISHEEQGDLNVHTTGKSINAIRAFTGKGNLVWGARTLAGNDNEWRYISVRRFFNMVEESVSKASEQFVFEGNDANTWVRIRAMIENFLVLQWKAGALAGAKAEQAFYVRVGLGSTMTSQDILEGRMIIEIGMAVVRPAEFIILRFSHKMQEA